MNVSRPNVVWNVNASMDCSPPAPVTVTTSASMDSADSAPTGSACCGCR